jgi:multiple sugar transport system permease protein
MNRIVSLKKKEKILGVILICPAVCILIGVVGYPVIRTISISFYRYIATKPGHSFVGFSNYRYLLSRQDFWDAFYNTLIFASSDAVGRLVLGLSLALLLNREFRGRGLARALLLLPWAVPITSWVVSWRWLFDNMFGLINLLLMDVGILQKPINFLGTREWALPCCIIVGILRGYPLFMVMLLAGLQAIPKSLYDVARVDGANFWQCFRFITIPSLRPIMTTAVVLSIIWSFNVFNVIWILTKGGPLGASHVLGTYAYELAFAKMRYDRSAATCVLTLLLLAVFLFLYIKVKERGNEE